MKNQMSPTQGVVLSICVSGDISLSFPDWVPLWDIGVELRREPHSRCNKAAVSVT